MKSRDKGSACGESTPTNLLVWDNTSSKNKIQPTNEQRNYKNSGTSSRQKKSVQPLNAQGEVLYLLSIPICMATESIS
jgi:hypothetical protein